MRRFFKHFSWLFFGLPLVAQVQEEVEPPSHIKTIIFTGPTEDQFPMLTLNESLQLTFDDLTANEQDYYYKIIHCDYDWQPSQLLKSQYLEGVDNQRIIDYGNSLTTLQPYSNYRLTIPNAQVALKVTGNYVLEIYNTYNELQFSRRFIVYKNLVRVGATIKRSRDFTYLNEKQVVHFTINTAGFPVVNPKQEIKIALLQNYMWPSARYNIKPQFTIGNELVYRYDQETAFYGGNEFLNFDTKDLRSPTFAVARIDFKELYHHYLFPNEFRNNQKYTFFPDINGDFVVRTLQGDDVAREAEYTEVHFTLPYDPILDLNDVYVIGKYNNYALTDENRMVYNEETGNMELVHLFKQGFYNYKYVVQKEDGTVDLNTVSGDFHFTENTYHVLVYYRDFGEMYDSIIGIGTANSSEISN
ncbi:MAG: DUF5103 domain-containing protein [Bacteroidota bacterium]